MQELAEPRYSLVAEPCRNFNILGKTVILDPWDNREKLVLSNFALGGKGTIIFIDTETGAGEQFVLPRGYGAWGIVNWHDEKLVIGTCVDQAYLHVFDLQSRTWAEPLESVGESYFWQMTLGSDDKVYGGTYPGCSLMQYDPRTHTLVNLGRVSDNEKNLYSRPVWGEARGLIFVQYGFDTNGLKAYSLEDETWREFGPPGAVIREVCDSFVCAALEDELLFFDPATLEPLDGAIWKGRLKQQEVLLANGQKVPVLALRDGRLAGFRGQDYFIADARIPGSLAAEPIDVELRRIPVEAPPTEVFSLTPDRYGQLWGSSGFGQTIFRYDPESGDVWNSSSVCNHGGEVYGMVFVGDRLFLSSYVGGDHIVYDPAKPWDQLNNLNPRTLQSVAPALIRPEGRSVLGPDGGVWTGWSAQYGTYGGGLSRVDPESLEVESWYDPIPGEQVAGLAADSRYLYFTTNGGASGLAFRTIRCHFGVWKPGEGLTFSETFEEGEAVGYALAAIGGVVAVGVGASLRIFDPETMSFLRRIPLPEPANWLVKLGEDRLGAFCGKELLAVDLSSGDTTPLASLPDRIRAATMTETGDLYFSSHTRLYVLGRTELAGN